MAFRLVKPEGEDFPDSAGLQMLNGSPVQGSPVFAYTVSSSVWPVTLISGSAAVSVLTASRMIGCHAWESTEFRFRQVSVRSG